jgi:hypothetical protein
MAGWQRLVKERGPRDSHDARAFAKLSIADRRRMLNESPGRVQLASSSPVKRPARLEPLPTLPLATTTKSPERGFDSANVSRPSVMAVATTPAPHGTQQSAGPNRRSNSVEPLPIAVRRKQSAIAPVVARAKDPTNSKARALHAPLNGTQTMTSMTDADDRREKARALLGTLNGTQNRESTTTRQPQPQPKRATLQRGAKPPDNVSQRTNDECASESSSDSARPRANHGMSERRQRMKKATQERLRQPSLDSGGDLKTPELVPLTARSSRVAAPAGGSPPVSPRGAPIPLPASNGYPQQGSAHNVAPAEPALQPPPALTQIPLQQSSSQQQQQQPRERGTRRRGGAGRGGWRATYVPPAEEIAPPKPPLASIAAVVTLVQAFAAAALAAKRGAHRRRRWPSALFLQAWLRYRMVVRRLHRAEITEEGEVREAPDRDPVYQWTDVCRRCADVLSMLRVRVIRLHAVKVRDLQRWRDVLCGQKDCLTAFHKLVRDTQECNLHRNDPTSLQAVQLIHNIFRGQVSSVHCARLALHAAMAARCIRVQTLLRWQQSLATLDAAIVQHHWILETRITASEANLDALRWVQRTWASLHNIRKLCRQRREAALSALAGTDSTGVRENYCVERCAAVADMLERRWKTRPRSVNLLVIAQYAAVCCGNIFASNRAAVAISTYSGRKRCGHTLMRTYGRVLCRRFVALFAAAAVLTARVGRARLRLSKKSWAKHQTFVSHLHNAMLSDLPQQTADAVAVCLATPTTAGSDQCRCGMFRGELVRRIAGMHGDQLAAGAHAVIDAVAPSYEAHLCRACWAHFASEGASRLLVAVRCQRTLRHVGVAAAVLKACARFQRTLPMRAANTRITANIPAEWRLRERVGDRKILSLLMNATCDADRSVMFALKDVMLVDSSLLAVARVPPDSQQWGSQWHPRAQCYGCVCASCAALVPMLHKYCVRWMQTLTFVQCRTQWVARRRRRVMPECLAPASGGDTQVDRRNNEFGRYMAHCLRCPPIHDALAVRLTATHNALPLDRIRSYASIMCGSCKASVDYRIAMVERQHAAAVRIQRMLRLVRRLRAGRAERQAMTAQYPEKAAGFGSSASAELSMSTALRTSLKMTKGQCDRCTPLLHALRERISHAERKQRRLNDAVADKYTAAVCSRCYPTAEALLRQHYRGGGDKAIGAVAHAGDDHEQRQ